MYTPMTDSLDLDLDEQVQRWLRRQNPLSIDDAHHDRDAALTCDITTTTFCFQK